MTNARIKPRGAEIEHTYNIEFRIILKIEVLSWYTGKCCAWRDSCFEIWEADWQKLSWVWELVLGP